MKTKASLSATGPTESQIIGKGFVALSGTWVGTAAIQVDPSGDNSWIPLTDLEGAAYEFTGNVTAAIDNGSPVKTRINFTRTSGTLDVVLVGDN